MSRVVALVFACLDEHCNSQLAVYSHRRLILNELDYDMLRKRDGLL